MATGNTGLQSLGISEQLHLAEPVTATPVNAHPEEAHPPNLVAVSPIPWCVWTNYGSDMAPVGLLVNDTCLLGSGLQGTYICL